MIILSPDGASELQPFWASGNLPLKHFKADLKFDVLEFHSPGVILHCVMVLPVGRNFECSQNIVTCDAKGQKTVKVLSRKVLPKEEYFCNNF